MTAISATFEDVKRIKTRSAWQLIFEVPEDKFPSVLESLGNPVSGETIWVAIARIHEDAAKRDDKKSKLDVLNLPDGKGL